MFIVTEYAALRKQLFHLKGVGLLIILNLKRDYFPYLLSKSNTYTVYFDSKQGYQFRHMLFSLKTICKKPNSNY